MCQVPGRKDTSPVPEKSDCVLANKRGILCSQKQMSNMEKPSTKNDDKLQS